MDFPQFERIYSRSKQDGIEMSEECECCAGEMEAANVVRLWLSTDGLPSSVGAFLDLLPTIVDGCNLLVTDSGRAQFTLEDLRSFVRVVHSYFSLQPCLLYDLFEDTMMRGARQTVHQTADPYGAELLDSWLRMTVWSFVTAGTGSWAGLSCVWRTSWLPKVPVLISVA